MQILQAVQEQIQVQELFLQLAVVAVDLNVVQMVLMEVPEVGDLKRVLEEQEIFLITLPYKVIMEVQEWPEVL